MKEPRQNSSVKKALQNRYNDNWSTDIFRMKLMRA